MLKKITPYKAAISIIQSPEEGQMEILWVDPADLYVDIEYQRTFTSTNLRLLERMIRRWSWHLFKLPVVAERNGKLAVIDGQTTTKAALTRGITKIPVMKLIDIKNDMPTEAETFINSNTSRVAVSTLSLHTAALAAKRPTAVSVQKVVDEAGIRIPTSNMSATSHTNRVNICTAVKTLYNLLEKIGAKNLTAVLKVCAKLNLAPLKREAILCTEKLLMDTRLDPVKLTEVMLSTPYGKTEVEARQIMLRDSIRLYEAFAAIYAHKYYKMFGDE